MGGSQGIRAMLKRWKQILRYLSLHSRLQENQGVHNKVQSFEWSLISDDFFAVRLEFFQRLVSDCKYTALLSISVICPDLSILVLCFQTSRVLSPTLHAGGMLPSIFAGRSAGS